MADSTSTSTKADATFYENLEKFLDKFLDKKLKPLESKISVMQQKQDIFSKDVMSQLQKIQRLSDDLTDEQESAARRFKDEIYKVHDTLDDLTEAISDAKSYSRDNLDECDGIKDKVIKIHKHLKVREVTGGHGHDPEVTVVATVAAVDSLKEVIVPDLQVIKKLVKSRTSPKRKKRGGGSGSGFKSLGSASSSDIEADDVMDQNISTLTSDINEFNDKINKMENIKVEKVISDNPEKMNNTVL